MNSQLDWENCRIAVIGNKADKIQSELNFRKCTEHDKLIQGYEQEIQSLKAGYQGLDRV